MDNGMFAAFKWGAYFDQFPLILTAFLKTIQMSLLALILALVLGIIFGLMSVSRVKILRVINRVYVEAIQNVPLLLQIFVMYAIFPLIGINMSTMLIGIIAIGIYHGAYISEVFRSGISSIPDGQFEAARSQGFSYVQMMSMIILPQAIQIVMPPLAIQAANLIKNTSIMALVAGGELMYATNSFANSTSYYGPAYVIAAVLYFLLCFPLSRLALRLERNRGKRKIKKKPAYDLVNTAVTEHDDDINSAVAKEGVSTWESSSRG